MRFLHPTLLLFAVAAATPGTSAAIHAGDIPPLRLAELNLNNGRKLSDVLVQSYDATTNRFFIFVENTATVLPAALVPAEHREELKASVRRSDSGPGRERIGQPTPAPRLEAATPVERAELPALQPRELPNHLAAHRNAAAAHAERFYRFEFRAGSNQISVTALDFDLSDPEAIPGWAGRYRTTGRAFLEFYDSRGNSFQRATSAFEVVTEQKPGESVTVHGFERRS